MPKPRASVGFLLLLVVVTWWQRMPSLVVEAQESQDPDLKPIITISSLRIGTNATICCKLRGLPRQTGSFATITGFEVSMYDLTNMSSKPLDRRYPPYRTRQCARIPVLVEDGRSQVVCRAWYPGDPGFPKKKTSEAKWYHTFELNEPTIKYSGKQGKARVSEFYYCWNCSANTTFENKLSNKRIIERFSMKFIGENLEGYPNSTCPECFVDELPTGSYLTSFHMRRYAIHGRACLRAVVPGNSSIECRVSRPGMNTYLSARSLFTGTGKAAQTSSLGGKLTESGIWAWSVTGLVVVMLSALVILVAALIRKRGEKQKETSAPFGTDYPGREEDGAVHCPSSFGPRDIPGRSAWNDSTSRGDAHAASKPHEKGDSSRGGQKTSPHEQDATNTEGGEEKKKEGGDRTSKGGEGGQGKERGQEGQNEGSLTPMQAYIATKAAAAGLPALSPSANPYGTPRSGILKGAATGSSSTPAGGTHPDGGALGAGQAGPGTTEEYDTQSGIYMGGETPTLTPTPTPTTIVRREIVERTGPEKKKEEEAKAGEGTGLVSGMFGVMSGLIASVSRNSLDKLPAAQEGD